MSELYNLEWTPGQEGSRLFQKSPTNVKEVSARGVCDGTHPKQSLSLGIAEKIKGMWVKRGTSRNHVF
jgi:hypothetical protein